MTKRKAEPMLSSFGCPMGAGHNRRYGPPWSKEKKAQFAKLWNDGVVGSEIMKIMEFPYIAMVYCARSRMKLAPRPMPLRRVSDPVASLCPMRKRTAQIFKPAAVAPVNPPTPYMAQTNRPTISSADRRAQRKCLRCEKLFMSDGPGNRLCIRCGGASE